jgi:hypothetical protein
MRRTVAALQSSNVVSTEHVSEAIQYPTLGALSGMTKRNVFLSSTL